LVAKREKKPSAKLVTRDDCPWCTKLKKQLQLDGVAYEEVDRSTVGDFPFSTVPQLWINGDHIGGYSEYMEQTHNESNDDKYAECEACSG
jgi:glutaredoxin